MAFFRRTGGFLFPDGWLPQKRISGFFAPDFAVVALGNLSPRSNRLRRHRLDPQSCRLNRQFETHAQRIECPPAGPAREGSGSGGRPGPHQAARRSKISAQLRRWRVPATVGGLLRRGGAGQQPVGGRLRVRPPVHPWLGEDAAAHDDGVDDHAGDGPGAHQGRPARTTSQSRQKRLIPDRAGDHQDSPATGPVAGALCPKLHAAA